MIHAPDYKNAILKGNALAGSLPFVGEDEDKTRVKARATSRNSITSNRRSPFSNLDTNDWGRPSFSASAACVSPARRRAPVNNLRKC